MIECHNWQQFANTSGNTVFMQNRLFCDHQAVTGKAHFTNNNRTFALPAALNSDSHSSYSEEDREILKMSNIRH